MYELMRELVPGMRGGAQLLRLFKNPLQ